MSETHPMAVGLLGAGMTGSGWAARFLLNGVDVRLYDPDSEAVDRLRQTVADARRAYQRLTLFSLPAEGALSVVDSVAEAVRDVELVHESAPQHLELKQQLLAEASQTAAVGTIICSSTSHFRPSLLQSSMEHPERFLIAQPAQPVYLLPLVELCAGEGTSPDALVRTADYLRAVGMHPTVVRKDLDGLIANRLRDVISREAESLIHNNLATSEEIDDAIRYSLGLHQIDASEPSEKRDDRLVALLQSLRSQHYGPGETVARWEQGLRARTSQPVQDSGPVRTVGEIPPNWIDSNGHATESTYLLLCSNAIGTLVRRIGMTGEYLQKQGTYYTVESHLSHLGELDVGDRVEVRTQILGADEKRLHLFHVITRDGDKAPSAVGEQMLIHVDSATRRSSPVEDPVQGQLQELALLHAKLPQPERAGASIRMRRPKERANSLPEGGTKG